MFKVIGIVALVGVSYVGYCVAFDPYGTGKAHDARMAKAYDICVNELGITAKNGHTHNAQLNCISRTADLIKRGAKL